MLVIRWADTALSELNAVAEYIALQNPTAASALVQTVFTSVARLADFPMSGRIPPEISEFQYREIIVNPLRIFYRQQDENTLYIVHVLRQERDIRRYILDNR